MKNKNNDGRAIELWREHGVQDRSKAILKDPETVKVKIIYACTEDDYCNASLYLSNVNGRENILLQFCWSNAWALIEALLLVAWNQKFDVGKFGLRIETLKQCWIFVLEWSDLQPEDTWINWKDWSMGRKLVIFHLPCTELKFL